MSHWNRFPKGVVDALELSKVRLDKALGSLIWWEVALHIRGLELEYSSTQNPSQGWN